MMFVNAPAVLGWFLIATASHSEPWFLYQVYAGRLLTGFATGLVSIPVVVYAGEVLHKTWRAVVVTWPSFGKWSRDNKCLDARTTFTVRIVATHLSFQAFLSVS
jgi:MFS family permease